MLPDRVSNPGPLTCESGALPISHPIKQECITLWILVQSDTVNDFILFVGQCDLYFMVQ